MFCFTLLMGNLLLGEICKEYFVWFFWGVLREQIQVMDVFFFIQCGFKMLKHITCQYDVSSFNVTVSYIHLRSNLFLLR